MNISCPHTHSICLQVSSYLTHITVSYWAHLFDGQISFGKHRQTKSTQPQQWLLSRELFTDKTIHARRMAH